MPEIPNVVSGEPVEADWGNDIRDRSVQKYADQTALDFSQPLPQLGELAWLINPGWLVVCTDVVAPATWTPLLDRDQADGRFVEILGDTMVGNLDLPTLTATNVVEAGTSLRGPLQSYYADSSGILPITTTPQDVGAFTVPVSGRYLMIAQLQGNYSGLSVANNVRLRMMYNGTQQVSVALVNTFEQWSGNGGISSGAFNVGMQFVGSYVAAGNVYSWDVGWAVAPQAGGGNATDFDWYAQRLDAVAQPQLAWTP